MVFLKAWLLLPALLALISLGWGLAIERASGARLPGVLLVPVGLAAVMVVARATMTLDATAELSTPVVVLGALAGLVIGRDRLRTRAIDRWAAAAALGVFALYAAPVVLSGAATFAGYTVLGDTAVHFVLIDRIASHGTNVSGLPPSNYRTTLEAYFASGYPLGAHAGLAAVRPLAFLDVAWAFQPYLAFVAAALTMTLVGLVQDVLRRGWRTAAVAALAAQPALVFAYAMQGSVKELVTLWLVPLLAALVGVLATAPDEPGPLRTELRRPLPLAVASAAGVAAIGVAVAPWLGPILLVGVFVVARRLREARRVAALAAAFAAAVVLLSLPTLLDLGDYLDVTKAVVTGQQEFGNLLGRPLESIQAFGIWLSGDFRVLPTTGEGIDSLELTYMLIGLAAVSAILGVAWLLRRRALAPLLFIASSLIALWYVTRAGSPWADAKGLAIASPAVLLAAALGPAALESRGARLEGATVAALLVVGVVVSNALVYHDVSLAPRDRLAELATVGDRTAGQGPLLYTEFEEFAKHFLRDGQPVGATEGFPVAGLTPRTTPTSNARFGFGATLDDLRPADLQRFKTIVVRRSPVDPRPPASFSLAWTGRYYEIWRRTDGTEVRRHLTLSSGTSRRDCAVAGRLAREADDGGGELLAAPHVTATVVSFSRGPLPQGWSVRQDDPSLVQTVGPGTIRRSIHLQRGGRYEVWISGSFGREVSVELDGRRVGAVHDELSRPPGWDLLRSISLAAGTHTLRISRGGGSLAPGNGDRDRSIGPFALREAPAPPSVRRLSSPSVRRACAGGFDWIELVSRAQPAARSLR